MSGAGPLSPATGLVDLHTHSTASDGTLTPTEVVAEGVRAGLEVLALTDHDTVDGLSEFIEAGRQSGLEVYGGVEISLEHPATFHLLGYNLTGGAEIPSELERLKAFRDDRNRIMLDRINALGYDIEWSRLKELSGEGQLGRPHFATALMEKGYFQNRQDVFIKLLAKGQPGYVDKIRLSPAEGLAMVRAAGWVPVLAHPVSLELDPADWPGFMAELVDLGLAGVEVFHPNLDDEQSRFFRELSDRFNLVPTCGSDFHGANKPAIHLNWTRNNSGLGRETIEMLRRSL
ncbi:hypothetical protein C4J81_14200 [Deltaproteobacteria bacterium Smac51]|nr:hypothetical protein C4J81_14200 [Deltaproteobacteria bacterium Smac51]